MGLAASPFPTAARRRIPASWPPKNRSQLGNDDDGDGADRTVGRYSLSEHGGFWQLDADEFGVGIRL
jgi:hypothetical protein